MDETEAEIRHVGSLLEAIAKNYADDSPEWHAIADAASAFILVQQHRSLASSFRQLKAAHDGQFTDEMLAKLKALGIDPEDLDDDI